jgi:aryl-alcohol dehydrogenase-like predicted oxidoreductase
MNSASALSLTARSAAAFLTATVTRREDLRSGDARLRMPRFEEQNLRRNLELVAALRQLAGSESCTPAQPDAAIHSIRSWDLFALAGVKRGQRKI